MYKTQLFVLLLAIFGLVSSRPHPGDEGGHTHIKIHVPYHVHKHTHTIVKKIYIPVKKRHHDSSDENY